MSIAGEHANRPTRKRPLTGTDKPATVLCTVVAIDHENLSYRECKVCNKALPENVSGPCRSCTVTNRFNPSSSGSRRVFRVLMSIATDSKISKVIMFDRVARVLFGCSADDFFDFAKTHPLAAIKASKALEGEMLSVTLSEPKNGNAQHTRVKSVVPIRTGFQPAINALRESYSMRTVEKLHTLSQPLPGTSNVPPFKRSHVYLDASGGLNNKKRIFATDHLSHSLGDSVGGGLSSLNSAPVNEQLTELQVQLDTERQQRQRLEEAQAAQQQLMEKLMSRVVAQQEALDALMSVSGSAPTPL